MTKFLALVPMIISKSCRVSLSIISCALFPLIGLTLTHLASCLISIFKSLSGASVIFCLSRPILPPSRLGTDRVITGPQFVGTVSPFHALIAQLMRFGVHSCVNLPLR